LCSFYNEFGKNLWQVLAKPQRREFVPSSKTLLREERGSSSLPAAALKPSPLPVVRGKVIWTYVNLRSGPGTRYRIIGKAYFKNTFEILAENPGWIRVRLGNAAEGWMSKRAALMTPLKPSPEMPLAASQDSPKTGYLSKPPGPM